MAFDRRNNSKDRPQRKGTGGKQGFTSRDKDNREGRPGAYPF